jgi:hypothetical protein
MLAAQSADVTDHCGGKQMLWIYKRGSESIRVETRYDNDSEEYVLISDPEDGTQQAERFKDPIAFRTRLEALEKQLERDSWQSDGVRLLRDGWKI